MTNPVIEQVSTGWTTPLVTERCRILATSLRALRVPDAELEAMAPGGAENRETDPLGAAVVWYALLRTRLELERARAADESARAQQYLDAALASEPVVVQLSVAGGPEGPRAVHAKSFHTLRYLDALDASLRRVVETAAALDDVSLEALAILTGSLATRVWAWILTHPGPGLPFDDAAEVEPPAWTLALSVDDLVELLRAHHQVNRERIAAIARLFPSDTSVESRLTLGGFLGTVAQELDQRPFDVIRRWSVGEAFAQAAVAAQAAKEGRERAEEESKSRRTA